MAPQQSADWRRSHGGTSSVPAPGPRPYPVRSRLVHCAPSARLCLHIALAAITLLWSTSAAAIASNVSIVGTSRDLYLALSSDTVRVIYLSRTLTLDSADWETPLTLQRNVTIAAHPRFQDIQTYITLDLASLPARVFLQPGVELRFSWVELQNYVVELGQTMLLIAQSPGGRVVFETVVQRRRAGLSGEKIVQEVMALPLLPGDPSGKQEAFLLPRFEYNVSRSSTEQVLSNPAYAAGVATSLPPTTSVFLAPGVPLGLYDMVMMDVVHHSEVVVAPDCTPGMSELDCIIQQLKLLAIYPVIIRTKASDSNLVKIVASLAILAVSVVLFLYFRRHYKTYQQRRARRMRRLKEALGMGPEAHGVMFNGLDGDEPEWQIMPMPVGYAAEDEGAGGEVELHQDSNLRNLIKDISTRPHRCIPEYGEGDELRLDMTDCPNCPIAEEVGLRPSNAAAAAVAAAAAETGAGDAARGEGPHAGGAGGAQAGGRWAGTGLPSPSPEGMTAGAAAEGGGGGGQGGGGGGALLSSVGSGGGSHPSTSGGGASRLLHKTTTAAGGGGGLQRLASPPLALTAAGMDVLLASRAAAVGLIVASGSDGAAGLGGSRSKEGTASGPAMALNLVAPVGGGAGSSGTAAAEAAAVAAASRHATNVAAADVAQRVMRSRDSDDGRRNGSGAVGSGGGGGGLSSPAATTGGSGPKEGDGGGGAGGGPVMGPNLMDELEELRRDIMAGINDTQLQIMSVVGSGAFGTVYRGQWQGLEVAVKTVVFSASSENRKRALQEAALCQSINHRNIVATYAVDVQPLGAVNTPVLLSVNPRNSTLQNLLDWRLYIVQEYCDGGPLRKLVQSQYLITDRGPNMPVICEVALELAQALAHLHSKNIIHGDLNPNNVLLKRDNSSPNGFRVKMADFGLSVMVPLQKTHMSNLRLGTLYYIAPETCFRGQLGYAADVFSMGVMLWELFHGRLAGTRTPTGEPRYQPDFPDFPATCPPDYRKLAHRCLQKQPHNRLHSSQVVQRLQEMLAAYRAGAVPPTPVPPLPLGGPDEVLLPPPPPPRPPLAAALRGGGNRSGTPTPVESRHKPGTPASPASVAAAGGGGGSGGRVSPEISPWGGGGAAARQPVDRQ